MAKRYDILLRILLLGDSGVGKTSMICRYTEDKFHGKQSSTIGIDFMMKRAMVDDTKGYRRTRKVLNNYSTVLSSRAMYDIANKESFEHMEKWYNCIIQNAQEDVEVMLIGNKTDVDQARKISKNEGQTFADLKGIPFCEVSAKSSENINLIFQDMANRIVRNRAAEFRSIRLEREDSESSEADLQLEVPPQKKNCCT